MKGVGISLTIMSGLALGGPSATAHTASAPADSGATLVLPTIDGFSTTLLSGTGVDIDRHVEDVAGNYYTYGTFFDTTQIPNFGNGGAPFTDPRSLSPAQPRSVYAGLKATF